MINFTVGPVQSGKEVLRIGGEDCPYFRTAEFSETMLESERLVKKFAGAPEGSRVGVGHIGALTVDDNTQLVKTMRMCLRLDMV